MKLRIFYILFSFAAFALLFLNNSAGRANGQNWGNTGAPGDETLNNGNPRTCQSCHATGNIQVTLDLEVLDINNDLVSAYIPNEIYTVKVSINHVSGPIPAGYGFQLVSLFDKDHQDVNGWADTGHSSNVQIAAASNTGRVYAEHNDPSDSNEFLIKWIAPEAGKGAVTFYSCGNGVNRNDNSSGDGAAQPRALTLSENVVSATRDALSIVVNVAPNPVGEILFLNIEGEIAETIFVKIIGLNGRIHYECSKEISQDENFQQINLSRLESGIYILQITTTDKIFIKKLMKL